MTDEGFQAHIDELAAQVTSLRAELAAANARNDELERLDAATTTQRRRILDERDKARTENADLRERIAELTELLDEFVDWRTDCILSTTGCDLHGFSLNDGEKCPHRQAKEAILASDSGDAAVQAEGSRDA